MTKSIVRPLGAFMILAFSALASAQSTQAVEWKVSDGGNGHWYRVFVQASPLSWDAARASAAGIGGALASINTAAEQTLIEPLLDGAVDAAGCHPNVHVGLSKVQGQPWRWEDGSPLGYTAWNCSEPYDPDYAEGKAVAYSPAGFCEPACAAHLRWNDFPRTSVHSSDRAYVVEWSADCNNDGIVDYGQILRGELADTNGNGVPDCCDLGSECVVTLAGPIVNPADGHIYYLLSQSTWAEAEAKAQVLGGHLTTIETLDENDFVTSAFGAIAIQAPGQGDKVSLWIGLSDFAQEGNFVWADGSNSSYVNFVPGEPYGGIADEDYIGISITPNPTWYGKWHDIVSDSRQGDRCYGVIEIVPSIVVPGDYPTIQAAIDAATPSLNLIRVSEGTYAEAIDFKGKAVTVKAVGSRANTIIDGTGLTTSVVRAVTGETPSTVLEGFTIRNGPVGSERNSLRLGGGMYIANASPTVRNCAFVNNAAGYGGGLYGLYSNALVENCSFSQNFATSDAGGLQFFGGSPLVRNCVISDNTSTYRGGGVHLVQWQSGFPTLDGCTVTGNRSQVSEGGGVSVVPDATVSEKCVVTDCTITGNSAQGRGGGLHAPVNTVGMPRASVVLAGNTICSNLSAISKRENTWLLFEDGGNAICDCFSDVDGNGMVDFGDLAFTLLFVGDLTDPDFIQPDQDMNGLIDTGDIAMLLLNFGSCD